MISACEPFLGGAAFALSAPFLGASTPARVLALDASSLRTWLLLIRPFACVMGREVLAACCSVFACFPLDRESSISALRFGTIGCVRATASVEEGASPEICARRSEIYRRVSRRTLGLFIELTYSHVGGKLSDKRVLFLTIFPDYRTILRSAFRSSVIGGILDGLCSTRRCWLRSGTTIAADVDGAYSVIERGVLLFAFK